MEKIERQSNFELLRILAMFLIVLHHFCVHGIFTYWKPAIAAGYPINTYICEFLSIGGMIANNIFILITGYFMIGSNFKIEKFLKLLFKLLFYPALLMIILWLFYLIIINKDLGSIFFNCYKFTIKSGNYWFMVQYLSLYLLSPFINTFIHNASKKQHIYFILLIGFIWSILQPFVNIPLNFCELGWFIYLYCIGAYFRIYPNEISNSIKINIVSLIMMYFITILILLNLNATHFIQPFNITRFFSNNNIIILVLSLNYFLIFKNINIKNNFINSIAQSVFGIYLIHDNDFIRPILWNKTLNVISHINSDYFIFWAFGISLGVFVVCLFIDKIFNVFFKIAVWILQIDRLSFVNKFINEKK